MKIMKYLKSLLEIRQPLFVNFGVCLSGKLKENSVREKFVKNVRHLLSVAFTNIKDVFRGLCPRKFKSNSYFNIPMHRQLTYEAN